MLMPDTPLDLLARELGARAGRLERDNDRRVAAAISDFDRRTAQVEMRMAAFDPGAAILSTELAVEVARAVRTLHEAPPIVERNEPPVASRVVRIERDTEGNLVPIYDEATS